ncbi:MAG TPA: J domain-containing protein [Paucimonas sp.]|nr:J domain-containing protein [Paucimonas sp.]
MPRIHTHYDNLKVARDAPPEVIRAAYRTLSKKYHPDHNPNNKEAIRIIQLVNAAYEVLSDPLRREEHDRWIARMETEDAAGNSHWSSSGASPPQHRQAHARHAPPKRPHRHHAASTVQRLVLRIQTALDQFSRYLSNKA